MIELEFIDACRMSDIDNPQLLWREISRRYTSRRRHYHNLQHLDQLLSVLLPFKSEFSSWPVVIFATAYHDIIYNVLRKDNEVRSANFATTRLKNSNLSEAEIARCANAIRQTQSHEVTHTLDIDLFTDADLSILGSDEKTYRTYADAIRREYWIYPDRLYYPGRLRVLEHFLAMPRLFKTSQFFIKYEELARQNILREMNALGQRK